MTDTGSLQGIRRMSFSKYHELTKARELTQVAAAELLGMSERSFRRYSTRYEADGAEGLFDRRLSQSAHNRVPVDTMDFTRSYLAVRLLNVPGKTINLINLFQN